MKENFHSAGLLFLVFLLIISTSESSARNLAFKEEEANFKINDISSKSVLEMEDIDSFSNLMGLEKCQNEDEECINRRALAEAHLDYIYTQHDKP